MKKELNTLQEEGRQRDNPEEDDTRKLETARFEMITQSNTFS